MNKAETTYRIVKKLEKAEKKALSLEMSKFKSSASYILIYNYFNKQEEFDQNHFTAFCKKNKLKYAGTQVNHLLNKILKILRKYRITINTDKIEIEIKKLYDEAIVFKELGFFKESVNKYKKALQIATKHKKYLLMPQLIWEVGQSVLTLKDTSLLKNMNPRDSNMTLLSQMQLTTKRIEDIWLDNIVYAELLILNLVKLPLKEQNDELKELLQYEPKKYDADDFEDVCNYYSIKISQAYAANDIKNYMVLIKELLAQLQVFFKTGTQRDILLVFSARLFGLYQKQFFLKKSTSNNNL